MDLARHGHDGDLAHGVVRKEGVLYLHRGDVLAAADDLRREEEARERRKRRKGEEKCQRPSRGSWTVRASEEERKTRTMSLARSEM